MPTRLIMKTTIESSGRMHSPAHPGEILREMYMVPLGVTVTKVADALGVTRKHVSAIVNGRAPITPDMAGGAAGGVGPEPEGWGDLQGQYGLLALGPEAETEGERRPAGRARAKPGTGWPPRSPLFL